MAYEIVWAAEADNDCRVIITYLTEKWSLQVAEKFLVRTYNKLERLAQTPSIARSTSKNSVYMFKFDKKNVVFFTLEKIVLYY